MGALIFLAVPPVAWALSWVIDRLGWLDEEYDPNRDYDFDQEPFGGELR